MGQSAKRRCGFTLVELLVVVIVIAILAAIAIPKFTNASLRGKEATLRGDLKQLRNACDLFHSDVGYYPNAITDLAATTQPAKVRDSSGHPIDFPSVQFYGPYISQIDSDPIDGSSYNYSNGIGGSYPLGWINANSGTALDGSNYANW